MRSRVLALVIGLGITGPASFARAHISLERATPSTHKSRNGDGSDVLKTGPCGRGASARGTNIYTYEPGSTIVVNVSEYILHPGYFRISFSQNGDADFVDPQSIMPMNRECLDNETRCGKTDFCGSPSVLLDNVDAHWQMDGTPTPNPPPQRSWQVKLPDVECDNCTLQVIQIMTDPLGRAHGPFDLTSDIYYQCIDLVLKRGGGGQMNPPPAPKPLMGMDCKANAAGAGGTGGSVGTAGSGGSGAAGMGAAGSSGSLGSAGSTAVASGGSGGSTAPAGAPTSAAGRPAPTGMAPPATTPVAGAAATPPVVPMPPVPVQSSGCAIQGRTATGVLPGVLVGLPLLLLAARGALRRKRLSSLNPR